MKILILGLAALGLVVGGSYYGLAAAGPDAIGVERSVHVDADSGDLLPLVHDLEEWKKWSSWTQREEAPEVHSGDITSGTGARWEWEDNGRECWLEFTNATPSGVDYQLRFGEFPVCQGTVHVVPAGSGRSSVTWTLTSDLSGSSMARAFGFFIDFDRAIGSDFENGLENLKRLVESGGESEGEPESGDPAPANSTASNSQI